MGKGMLSGARLFGFESYKILSKRLNLFVAQFLLKNRSNKGTLLIVVQLLSCDRFFTMAYSSQAFLQITSSHSLLKFMSIKSVMPSNHLILCRPLDLLPSIFPSIRVFSKELVLRIRWPKYWSFNFRISPSNEYSELIFFRMDWLDLLAVQRTFTSLLQHHRSRASILQCSAFFMVQLSNPYMTTRKTIAMTRWTFVSKVMSLLLI